MVIHFIKIFYLGIIAFFQAYDFQYGINFFIVNTGSLIKQLTYFIFGSGLGDLGELGKRYSYIGIYGMEWRIFNILFRYGIIQIIIIGFIFINFFKQKNINNNMIFQKAIMLQFLMSLPHYIEVYTIGVFQIFLTLYAIFTTQNLILKKNNSLIIK